MEKGSTFQKSRNIIAKSARASVIILVFLYLLRFFVKNTQALGYSLLVSILIDVGCFVLLFLGDFLVTFITKKLFHKDATMRSLSLLQDIYGNLSFKTKKTPKDRNSKGGKVDEKIKKTTNDIYTDMLH